LDLNQNIPSFILEEINVLKNNIAVSKYIYWMLVILSIFGYIYKIYAFSLSELEMNINVVSLVFLVVFQIAITILKSSKTKKIRALLKSM
jgi:hypothetical protein